MINVKAEFEKHEDEFLKFDRVRSPGWKRPDICAFVLLDHLVPGKGDMVACAEHDQIWLNVDLAELEKVATPEHILTLLRCGVRYDEDTDSLSMFV